MRHFTYVLALLGALLAQPALAEERPAHMTIYGLVPAPMGWILFCQGEDSDACTSSSASTPYLFFDEVYSRLRDINRSMNVQIQEVHIEGSVAEHKWAIPRYAYANSAGLALLKRRFLLTRGIPRGALLLTEVQSPFGPREIVLMVVTDKADLVLSPHGEILPWWQTRYSFLRRQSPVDPNIWFSLEEQERPVYAFDPPK